MLDQKQEHLQTFILKVSRNLEHYWNIPVYWDQQEQLEGGATLLVKPKLI